MSTGGAAASVPKAAASTGLPTETHSRSLFQSKRHRSKNGQAEPPGVHAGKPARSQSVLSQWALSFGGWSHMPPDTAEPDQQISQIMRLMHLKVLRPTSKHVRRWDLVMMLLLFFTATVTPFEVAFTLTHINVMFFINRFVDCLFLIDMVLQFFVAYENEDRTLVFQHSLIVRRYLYGSFWLDMISIFPYEVLSLKSSAASSQFNRLKILRIMRLAKLTKLMRIVRAGRTMKRMEAQGKVDYRVFQLVKFAAVTVACMHWMACGWNLITDIEAVERNWATEANVVHASLFRKYVASLYWATQTMGTIGYGDIHAITTAERAYAVCAMLVGASLYAYMVGNICGIVASFNSDQQNFYKTMDSLNEFMAEKLLPKPLRTELREYFRYSMRNRSMTSWQHLMDVMSPSLQGEVLVHTYAKWVKQIPFFANFSPQVLGAVAVTLKQQTLSAHEVILRTGEDPEKIFILMKGMVSVSKGFFVMRGQVVGDDALFTSGKRTYSAKTISLGVALVLTKSVVLQAISLFPEVMEALRKARVRWLFREHVVAYSKAVIAVARADSGDTRKASIHPTSELQAMFEAKLLTLRRQEQARIHAQQHMASLMIQRCWRRYHAWHQPRKQHSNTFEMLYKAQEEARRQRKLQDALALGLAHAQTTVPEEDMLAGFRSLIDEIRGRQASLLIQVRQMRADIDTSNVVYSREIASLRNQMVFSARCFKYKLGG